MIEIGQSMVASEASGLFSGIKVISSALKRVDIGQVGNAFLALDVALKVQGLEDIPYNDMTVEQKVKYNQAWGGMADFLIDLAPSDLITDGWGEVGAAYYMGDSVATTQTIDEFFEGDGPLGAPRKALFWNLPAYLSWEGIKLEAGWNIASWAQNTYGHYFPAGAMIALADGTWKAIEQVRLSYINTRPKSALKFGFKNIADFIPGVDFLVNEDVFLRAFIGFDMLPEPQRVFIN